MKRTLLALLLSLAAPSAFAEIEISPMSLDFFNQQVNSLGPEQMVVVTNGGSAPADLEVINLCSIDFQVLNLCESTLQPGQECEVEVQFEPHEAGYDNCEIEFEDMSGGGGTAILSVSGTGVE